jgi:FtsH-binding integral membrane protein
MTFPAWGRGSSEASSLSVGTFFSLPFLLLINGRVAVGMTGLVGIFIPFSHTIDLLYAIGGTILFSGYIVYDTYLINGRLSPDEYIMAAISLYLECVPIPLSPFSVD